MMIRIVSHMASISIAVVILAITSLSLHYGFHASFLLIWVICPVSTHLAASFIKRRVEQMEFVCRLMQAIAR